MPAQRIFPGWGITGRNVMSASSRSGFASLAAFCIASIFPASSAARRFGCLIRLFSVITPSPLTAPKNSLPSARKLKSFIPALPRSHRDALDGRGERIRDHSTANSQRCPVPTRLSRRITKLRRSILRTQDALCHIDFAPSGGPLTATGNSQQGEGHAMDIKVGRKAIAEASEKLRNWGRWGKDDQIGTLNHIRPEDIVKAASLIQTGKVFALGIPLDRKGPQTGLFGGRWNPIHTMLATGTDAVAGRQDAFPNLRYADDAINMPVQCATHWDSLGHIFYEETMYNGHDARLADSNGLGKLGIEHSRNKMVGRGVLLDVARFKNVDCLPDGYGISNAELDACARAQDVAVGRGDFVIIRTGQLEKCLKHGWGAFAGGDAPGVKFENCYWCHEK